MNYILLDLEWNSAYYKPQGRFINEIIQIGAVKLDENFNYVDSFQSYIKSKIVKKLSRRTIDLTGITNEQMNSGVVFREAVNAYNAWAGNDTVTLTWSNSDLYAIVENSRIFLDNSIRFELSKYVDLQSFVQGELKLMGYAITNQISLANAAELLQIDTTKFELHNALVDAYLCSIILGKVYNQERFLRLIRDADSQDFYERLFFRPYYISNINDKRVEKKNLKFVCPTCKKSVNRQNKWKFKNNWFRSEMSCSDCNLNFRTMVSFKQTYDKIVVKKRILPIVANHEVENVKV